jgi:hypothetical protein
MIYLICFQKYIYPNENIYSDINYSQNFWECCDPVALMGETLLKIKKKKECVITRKETRKKERHNDERKIGPWTKQENRREM